MRVLFANYTNPQRILHARAAQVHLLLLLHRFVRTVVIALHGDLRHLDQPHVRLLHLVVVVDQVEHLLLLVRASILLAVFLLLLLITFLIALYQVSWCLQRCN